MQRRQFIVSSSAIGVTTLAGCSGDSATEESGSDGSGDETEGSVEILTGLQVRQLV